MNMNGEFGWGKEFSLSLGAAHPPTHRGNPPTRGTYLYPRRLHTRGIHAEESMRVLYCPHSSFFPWGVLHGASSLFELVLEPLQSSRISPCSLCVSPGLSHRSVAQQESSCMMHDCMAGPSRCARTQGELACTLPLLPCCHGARENALHSGQKKSCMHGFPTLAWVPNSNPNPNPNPSFKTLINVIPLKESTFSDHFQGAPSLLLKLQRGQRPSLVTAQYVVRARARGRGCPFKN